MTHRNSDLILVVASSLILLAVILLIPATEAVRIILGLPLIIFFPGYILVAALFPRRADLEPIERIALSAGLSIAIVPLIGLALNYSPWGTSLDPILASATLFIVLAAVMAVQRRRLLPPDEAFSLAIDFQLLGWSQTRPLDKLLALALVLSVAGLGVAAFFATTSRGSSERFTEFYALGLSGKAEDYPSQVQVDGNAAVILGVVNHEGEDTTYRIAVMIDGENADSIDNLVLADDEIWENRVAIVPAHAGEDQKVEFILYTDDGSEPYRSLHLFLDVDGDVDSAVAGVARPSEGFAYVVQPGDTLAALAEYFGLGEEAIATANDLAESESLPVGEELVIPGVVHIVQPGETLPDIAIAFDVSLEVIMAVNDIEGRSTINVGQELAIPGG